MHNRAEYNKSSALKTATPPSFRALSRAAARLLNMRNNALKYHTRQTQI